MGEIGKDGHLKFGNGNAEAKRAKAHNERWQAARDAGTCWGCGYPVEAGHIWGCAKVAQDQRDQDLFDRGV